MPILLNVMCWAADNFQNKPFSFPHFQILLQSWSAILQPYYLKKGKKLNGF